MFVTAQPSAQIRFRKAVDAGSLRLAELTAREMHHLTLEDALELVILYASEADAKFERAACRWLGRLMLERERLTLAQAQFAAVALKALEDAPATAAATLRSVVGSKAG